MHSVLYLSLFLVPIPILCYASTWISFIVQQQSRDAVKVPPILPYIVPFVGNAFSFAFDPVKFLSNVTSVHIYRTLFVFAC